MKVINRNRSEYYSKLLTNMIVDLIVITGMYYILKPHSWEPILWICLWAAFDSARYVYLYFKNNLSTLTYEKIKKLTSEEVLFFVNLSIKLNDLFINLTGYAILCIILVILNVIVHKDVYYAFLTKIV